MMSPKKVKWRKKQKGRMRGMAPRGQYVAFGDYGIQALAPGWLTAREIEAARVAISRYVQKGAKLWVRIFPDKPITKKAAETRMGSGKGAVEGWVAVVLPGRILFELAGLDREHAHEALMLGAQKLCIRTSFVAAED